MCRLLHRMKWYIGYTSVSTTCTGRFIHKTQRWKLFCKDGLCRCLSTNGSWWIFQKSSPDQHNHRVLFQFNCLPFGVNSSQAIFQQTMDTMLTGLPGVSADIDNIIVTGTTPEELLHRLTFVLGRIQQYGFRLRSDKCKFFLTWVKYLGFIFDKNGRRPDPKNIHIIKYRALPADVSTLRSFLGLVSRYASFFYQNCTSYVDLLEIYYKKILNGTGQVHAKNHLSFDQLLVHYDPSVDRALPVTSEMIQDATAADPILQKVLHFHSTNWPNTSTDQKLQLFFQRRSS